MVVSYASFVNALAAHAQTPTALAAASALQSLSDPSHGAGFEISIGEARILGLAGPGSGTDDTVILNTDYWTASALQIDPGDVEAVIEHELSKGIMGRIGSLGVADAPFWAPMDLFRFTASGQRDFTGGRRWATDILFGQREHRLYRAAISHIRSTAAANSTAQTWPTGIRSAPTRTPTIHSVRVAQARAIPERFHQPISRLWKPSVGLRQRPLLRFLWLDQLSGNYWQLLLLSGRRFVGP